MDNKTFHHIPVMLDECIEFLDIKPNGIYLDGTAGGGGHSEQIAKRLADGKLIAIDKDSAAIKALNTRLNPYFCVRVVKADFCEMDTVLDSMGIGLLDGILLDLGVSSHQLDTSERGFSYHQDAALDMRMSGEGISARDLVNSYSAGELSRIFWDFGEERYARGIAARILREREKMPIESTAQLAEIIKSAIPPAARRDGHPAKRVFQALRIAVNGELDSLSRILVLGFERLRVGGRFAVITFHSLEDRMVKQAFLAYTTGCVCPPEFPICVCAKAPRAKHIGRKPIIPSEREIEQNNRARSAKLRIVERLA